MEIMENDICQSTDAAQQLLIDPSLSDLQILGGEGGFACASF